ncbi:MAG: hypothetical protein HYZ01_10210 [Ignavibacteriales bacterium]|nr:hypothetical protein [Ignavibacteriales bacterium]
MKNPDAVASGPGFENACFNPERGTHSILCSGAVCTTPRIFCREHSEAGELHAMVEWPFNLAGIVTGAL